MTNIVHHQKTRSPAECPHCGLVSRWAIFTHLRFAPEDVYLCIHCHNKLYNVFWDFRHNEPYDEENEQEVAKVHAFVRQWIADKKQKPHPRSPEKRFDHSVPLWMRNAIDSGKMKTNDGNIYVVSSQSDQVVSIEIVDGETVV